MRVHRLASESWLLDNNVEGLICTLPGLDQVFAGVHVVTAVGNDGMAVTITVDTGKADEAGEQADIVQMIYLGRLLHHFRMTEVVW